MRSRSIQRRIKFQQGNDFKYDMAGVSDIHLHEKGCGVWYEYDCDCIHSKLDGIERRYAEWEDDNAPRVSKSAKPKMGMSGRSLKTVITRIIRKKGKKR